MARWPVIVAPIAIALACGETLPSGDDSDPPPVRDSGAGDPDGPDSVDAGFDAPPSLECKDTATQSEHCGVCNRPCRGGQCVSGVCTPAVIAQGVITPLGIAVDATHVYWTSSTDSGSIERIAKAVLGAGQQPEKFEVNAGIQPKGIAVNATTVYWTTFTNLYRKPKVGGMAFEQAPGLPTDGIWWISATDSAVYYSSEQGATVGVYKTTPTLMDTSRLSDVATKAFIVDNDIAWAAGPETSPIRVSTGNGPSGETSSSFFNVNGLPSALPTSGGRTTRASVTCLSRRSPARPQRASAPLRRRLEASSTTRREACRTT